MGLVLVLVLLVVCFRFWFSAFLDYGGFLPFAKIVLDLSEIVCPLGCLFGCPLYIGLDMVCKD